MNFERCKRRLRSDRSGVSEVVGNILILLITVVLFSSIVAYVNQIPVPEAGTKADFAATVSFDIGDPTMADLTVTHAGGMVLRADSTAVVVQIDDTSQFYLLSEDSDFPYTTWSTGTDWTKSFAVPSTASEIIVSVIDLDKSSAIWTSQVSGGAGGTPPIILQRYADSERDSPTPDPVKRNDTFSFFVKVIDLDNDLSTVWLDVSDLPGTPDGDVDLVTEDGWYRFDFAGITEDVKEIDGRLIKIHAQDLAGHETISSYRLSVIILPTDTLTRYIPDPYEGGLPSYITWVSDGQGFGMYHEDGTSGNADVTATNTTFVKDEMVFIRVASLRLSNIQSVNSLTLTDMRTGYNHVPAYNTSLCSASAPFYPFTSSGGAFVYESQFYTSPLPPGAYAVSITLKSSSAVFQTVATLILYQEGSSIEFTPRMWTYNHVGDDWGTKTSPYDVSGGATSKVYVRVSVKDATLLPYPPSVDDVRIVDMRGDTQLHGSPPSGDMLPAWEANTTNINNQTYDFEINLRLNNGDQWIGGTHAYTLKISRFSDSNEGVYSLSIMIYVTASTARADFFVGGAGYMTGTSNFIDPQYLFQIQNNNFFTQRVLYDYSNAPSAADNYAVSALALGDLDGDGDKDILMGQYRSEKLYYIENSLNTFGSWQEASMISRPSGDGGTEITWIATGDVNGDGDVDFTYCTEGNVVAIINNTYGTVGTVWKDYTTVPAGSGVHKIDLKDMTGDGRDDLIVLANGIVRVYDLLDWDAESPIATIPESGTASIKDFDIADVDGDGRLDIATVDDTATSSIVSGARVSYYYDNPTPITRTLIGTTPDCDYGQATGLIEYTEEAAEGDALVLRENTTGEEDKGMLSVDIAMQTLTDSLDQTLTVRARVSPGGTEGFYVWYSTSGDYFTPLIYIPATTADYTYFSVRLPPTVAGKSIELRFTDTIWTPDSGVPQEQLYLDYVAVETDLYGGYDTISTAIADYSLDYQCIRIGNLNGNPDSDDYGLEVVVAKDYLTAGSVKGWAAYNRTSPAPSETWAPLAGWADSSTTFYCRGGEQLDLHSSMSSDENPIEALLTSTSPKLFNVVDVNGDGYSDIIVVNTTVNDELTSQISIYLNMEPDPDHWWYFVVKDIAAAFNTPDVRGGMTVLLVDNLISQ